MILRALQILERRSSPRCRSLSSSNGRDSTCHQRSKLSRHGAYHRIILLTHSRRSINVWASLPWKLLATSMLDRELRSA